MFLVLVMNAVNVEVNGYVVTLLAIEWLSDRIETVANILGDAVGELN